MALVGGGGAPNVAGSNPAGVGSSLNYVGNLVYAYSGDITLNASLPNPRLFRIYNGSRINIWKC